jgi:hypothetical protein
VTLAILQTYFLLNKSSSQRLEGFEREKPSKLRQLVGGFGGIRLKIEMNLQMESGLAWVVQSQCCTFSYEMKLLEHYFYTFVIPIIERLLLLSERLALLFA